MSVLSLRKSVVISWKAQRHIFILKDKGQEGIQNLHSNEGCECGNHSCLDTLEFKKFPEFILCNYILNYSVLQEVLIVLITI